MSHVEYNAVIMVQNSKSDHQNGKSIEMLDIRPVTRKAAIMRGRPAPNAVNHADGRVSLNSINISGTIPER